MRERTNKRTAHGDEARIAPDQDRGGNTRASTRKKVLSQSVAVAVGDTSISLPVVRALVPRRLESARQLALKALRTAIEWGELPPGERISEADIAKRLHLSRTPIREAQQQLASEGLLEVVPRVGSFVRQIQPSEIDEVYQLKALLDPFCARIAAEKLVAADAERIRKLLIQMERYASSSDVRRFGEAIDVFHKLLLEITGSRLLPAIYAQFEGRIRWMRRRNLQQPTRLKQSLDQHREIAEAVLQHDPEAAEAATRRHVADAHRLIRSVSARAPAAAT